jgi:formylglycine-generating enzyme required for sulfatase activity
MRCSPRKDKSGCSTAELHTLPVGVITRLGSVLVAICGLCLAFTKGDTSTQVVAGSNGKETNAPPGMVWIPAGEFTMGTDDVRSFPNERPAHRVLVKEFWIDEHDVTNAEFAKFVEATGYVTTAERKPDWEELKKELPPGTPKPDDSVLVAGSLVFTPTSRPVSLNDLSAWWRWVPGANWRHPEGPDSRIEGRENHPSSGARMCVANLEVQARAGIRLTPTRRSAS